MKINNIDALNTFLILISFMLAYLLPFQLFLFVYAILGPLHYFTEINWIQNNDYFVKSKVWSFIIVVFAFLIAVPVLARLSAFDILENNQLIYKVRFVMPEYLNSLFFLSVVIAFSLVVFKNKKYQLISVLVGIIIAVLVHKLPLYHVVFGIFLPTIIHVYVFTLLFMLYGAIKLKGRIGYFNVLLVAVAPIMISFLTIDQSFYYFSDIIKSTYVGNRFHVLNANLSKIVGASDGTTFFFYEIADLKIQMFISFAYTYHYLNWFSKTTIIGWHKKLTQKRSILILFLWAISIGLYFYDYKIAISLLLFCSLIHVFMELPLNIISMKQVAKSVYRSIRIRN
ncbi:hypothetical protein [Aquimarina aquimarini]|uniref:hypothetical protein n=1 Tax=Aquimarina aquimarini TaxID=1191734 RepID=UPI00131EFDE4|nr:hypothetical protein [Aquimarina aquimarini]